jgi:hypothetical protein
MKPQISADRALKSGRALETGAEGGGGELSKGTAGSVGRDEGGRPQNGRRGRSRPFGGRRLPSAGFLAGRRGENGLPTSSWPAGGAWPSRVFLREKIGKNPGKLREKILFHRQKFTGN